jgi:hypothetical protein
VGKRALFDEHLLHHHYQKKGYTGGEDRDEVLDCNCAAGCIEYCVTLKIKMKKDKAAVENMIVEKPTLLRESRNPAEELIWLLIQTDLWCSCIRDPMLVKSRVPYTSPSGSPKGVQIYE